MAKRIIDAFIDSDWVEIELEKLDQGPNLIVKFTFNDNRYAATDVDVLKMVRDVIDQQLAE